MATILGSLDHDSFANLEDFLRKGNHDSALHDDIVGKSDQSDALSHGSHSDQGGPSDYLAAHHVMHAPMLLSQFGPMPMFGSVVTPTPPAPASASAAEPSEGGSARKRKSASVQDSTDWGQDDDNDSGPDDVFSSTRLRVAWTVNNTETWFRIFDANMNELPQPGFRVEMDKGFKHASEGEGWICQKKNHFQVTVAAKLSAPVAFVATRSGMQKVSGLFINVYGVKLPVTTDAAVGRVQLEQSQADRSKKVFTPVPIATMANDVIKMSVGRLHFTETTANNMRKRGKPNPDQRFFSLVVSLVACAGDSLYTLASHMSEKIIVRASNPALFESDANTHWVRGESFNSIYHTGPVGINVDSPEDALCVRGNIRLSGTLFQPSDRRVKTDIAPLDPAQQLLNVRAMRFYRYRLSDDWAETCGREGAEANECGVLAQEMAEVLPDAVRQSNDVALKNGTTIPQLLVVNKERIFMESVGAVKHLGSLAEELQGRIDRLETRNKNVCHAIRRSASLQELQSLVEHLGCTERLPSTSETDELLDALAPRTAMQRAPLVTGLAVLCAVLLLVSLFVLLLNGDLGLIDARTGLVQTFTTAWSTCLY